MLLGSQVEGLTREYGKMKVIGGLDSGHETRPEGADKRMNDKEVKAGSTSNLLRNLAVKAEGKAGAESDFGGGGAARIKRGGKKGVALHGF